MLSAAPCPKPRAVCRWREHIVEALSLEENGLLNEVEILVHWISPVSELLWRRMLKKVPPVHRASRER